ncbi:cyclin-J-like [Acropora muricata]|uniref:cyclin-J-like n=1 Tax=Acropora millepora TaxID=45264 RepID=UPI0010FC6990|nr:cyclin-J-like [Acropora millepora]
MMVESEWWKSPLVLEIHDVLREKEMKLPPFTSSSPQLKLRRFLVDWLAVISEKLKASHGVLHLAVYYMDYFMDKFDIQEPQLHLVALSCLLLAAKFEENEEKIPTIHTLNSFVHHVFSTAEFHQMELLLLNFFCWNLDLPTPVNFMEYYLVHAISPQDCQSGKSKEDCSKPMTYTRKYVHYFLEIALQDHSFMKFPPSVITSAAVAASRLRLHLCPTWTPHLIKVTSYTWEKIAPCVSIMLRAHDADENAMLEQKATNTKG